MKPRRRKTDHWLSFLHREASLVVLVFVVLGILAAGLVALRAQFVEHDRRMNAAVVCLLRAAGTPLPGRTVNELIAERDRLFIACVQRQAPGIKIPLKKEKRP